MLVGSFLYNKNRPKVERLHVGENPRKKIITSVSIDSKATT